MKQVDAIISQMERVELLCYYKTIQNNYYYPINEYNFNRF